MVLEKSGKREYLRKNISKQRREQQETQSAWMIDLVFRDTHKNVAAVGVFDPLDDFNHCRSTSKPKATRTVGIRAYDIVRLNHVNHATD